MRKFRANLRIYLALLGEGKSLRVGDLTIIRDKLVAETLNSGCELVYTKDELVEEIPAEKYEPIIPTHNCMLCLKMKGECYEFFEEGIERCVCRECLEAKLPKKMQAKWFKKAKKI